VPQNIIPKPACNVYNLGGPAISGFTVSRGQVIQNRQNYVNDQHVSRTEKKNKKFSSQNFNSSLSGFQNINSLAEKSLKYRIKPMKLEISGKAPQIKRSEIDFASEMAE
jgi:hypothetical protein